MWNTKKFRATEWMAVYDGKFLRCFFSLLPLSCHHIEPDELHAMYLGTVQYILGSVLWALCYQAMTGSAATNMEQVWDSIAKAYRDYDVANQYTNLTLTSFTNPDSPKSAYPKLKGKGMETRDLVIPMYSTWLHLAPPDFPIRAEITLVLESQCRIQNMLRTHRHSMFLPEDVASSLLECIESQLVAYTALGDAADRKGDLLWNCPAKFHWLWHLGDKASLLHPQVGITLIDEDFQGKLKEIAHACASGTELHNVTVGAMSKYRWLMHLLR